MDINIHNITHVKCFYSDHMIGDRMFHTMTLTFFWTDWAGKEHQQSITAYSDNEIHMERSYADCTKAFSENV